MQLDSTLPVALFTGALVCYAASALLSLRWLNVAAWLLGAGASIHLLGMAARGVAISYFPLTNKLESFAAASLAMALVVAFTWNKERLYVTPLLLLAAVTLGVALCFPTAAHYPPPLLRTVWYPLHVPLSFGAYALWAAAAAAGLAWFWHREHLWIARLDYLVWLGFVLWSLGMICGGIWGVLAWGAFFLWDPKVIWSVILWLFYGTFIHVRLTPSLAKSLWLRPALAFLGFAFVFLAYVGTSFFWGRSSHAFG